MPSKYTPANKKVTELFKAGTEPTEVSNRYDKLSDVTNLEGTYKNGVVTLTWDKIKEPDAINEEYLNKYARKYLTKKEDIEYYVNTRLKEVYSEFSKVSYDVYVLQDGEYILSGSTTDNAIDINIYSTSEPMTFVVKTSYEKFKTNASDGKEVTISFGNGSITIAKLNGNNVTTLNKGDTYTDQGVTVLDNMIDVTDRATITTTIKDKNNNMVSSVDTSNTNTYYIYYKITYKSYSKTLTRTVKIT